MRSRDETPSGVCRGLHVRFAHPLAQMHARLWPGMGKKKIIMKKKKNKEEKPILYEAFLREKYKNFNQEEETDIGELFFTSVK